MGRQGLKETVEEGHSTDRIESRTGGVIFRYMICYFFSLSPPPPPKKKKSTVFQKETFRFGEFDIFVTKESVIIWTSKRRGD